MMRKVKEQRTAEKAMSIVNREEKSQHPLGISAHYLQEKFLSEVKEAGLHEHSRIYEVENLRLAEPGVIRQKGAKIICPKDRKAGASYVDCLSGEDCVGPASFMLSYGWEYTIGDIVETLVSYCESENLNPKRTYFWICCLCINQHRVYENKMNGIVVDFLPSFNYCVKSIGHVLAMMSPWDEPVYLTRVWCIFEFFVAHENGCNVSIVMPSREKEKMIEAVGDVGKLFEALARTKIEDSNATEESDKIKIMKKVEETIGAKRLNQEVNERLREWIVDVLMECMTKSSEKLRETKYKDSLKDKVLEDYAALCDKVATIIYENGDGENALKILNDALNIRLKHQGTDHEDTISTRNNIAILLSDEGTLDRALSELVSTKKVEKRGSILIDNCALSINIGSILSDMGDFDGALAEYKNAEEDVQRNSITEAHLRMNIGIAMEEKGKSNSALTEYKKALEFYENIYKSDHPSTASAHNNIGNIYSIQGKFDEAKESLFKAKDIRLKVIGKDHQDTATTFNNIGHVLLQQGMMEEAVIYFEDALSITIDQVGDDHFSTADNYNGLGLVYLKMQSFEKASSFFLKALHTYKKVFGEYHPSFATVLFNIGCMLEKQGHFKHALLAFRKVETIRTSKLGRNHYQTIDTYNKNGSLSSKLGDLDFAQIEYQKILAAQSEVGEINLLTATTYKNIAKIYCKKGDISAAIKSLQEAETIQIQILGKDNDITLKTKMRIDKLKGDVGSQWSDSTASTTFKDKL